MSKFLYFKFKIYTVSFFMLYPHMSSTRSVSAPSSASSSFLEEISSLVLRSLSMFWLRFLCDAFESMGPSAIVVVFALLLLNRHTTTTIRTMRIIIPAPIMINIKAMFVSLSVSSSVVIDWSESSELSLTLFSLSSLFSGSS